MSTEASDLSQQQNSAYSAATSRLREKYRAEYDALIDEEFAKRGLTRSKRTTPEERAAREKKERLEKAQEALNRLLSSNPELGDYLRQQVTGQQELPTE